MAIGTPKGTVKTAKRPANEVASQETAKPDPPTIREIANKVARMSFEDRLRIFVLAGLMTDEEAQTAAQQSPKADRSNREKRAAKKVGRTSSS